MSNLDGLERSLLLRLSNQYDECGEAGWVTLNEVLLGLDAALLNSSDDVFELSPGKLVDDVARTLERAHADGLIDKYEDRNIAETRFRISDQGQYALNGFEELVLGSSPEQTVFDSSAWTGIVEPLTRERKEQLHDHLEALRACVRQSELDDRTKTNIGKRLDAVRALIEAPDPPWKAIIELLNHPALTAFLNFSAVLTILFGNN